MQLKNLLIPLSLISATVQLSHATENNETKINKTENKTRVVMLGTGNPGFDYKRDGQNILIVVNKQLYMFDAGPGFMKNINYLSDQKWMPSNTIFSNQSVYGAIDKLFITHLDSDHTLGIGEFLLRPWVQGRSSQPDVYGPPGTKNLVDYTIKAFKSDIDHRTGGPQPSNPTGFKAKVHEVADTGLIYQDQNIKVTAFKVPHSSWKTAFGYRVETPDKVIVMSGDTRFDENNLKYYQGADVLIHEVMSDEAYKKLPKDWQNYMLGAHTTTQQLADIANVVKPKTLVLNHAIFLSQSESGLLKEVTDQYAGKVILADDKVIID